MIDESNKNIPLATRYMKPPEWINQLEQIILSRISWHPNIISLIKLFVICPLLLLTFKQADALPNSSSLLLSLYVIFTLLDYLDGTVARHRKLETNFGRLIDRVADFPLLIAAALGCYSLLPHTLIAAKIGVDFLLILLYLLGRKNTENRFRTSLNHTTILSLIFLSQGWGEEFLTVELVAYFMSVNIIFSSVLILYNIGILKKKYIADALSASNLFCGIFSMIFAAKGRIDVSLLFLMLGAAFDGFDGAAARKFGGTRWGVYSDDIADGVNYGIAPGVAVYFIIGGVQGMITGIFYSLFTISRLIFFTLNKENSDPEYFCGAPSTVGALLTLSALSLFDKMPVVFGLMVGIACIQMVSFDTHYRHLGRALAANRRIIFGIPIIVLFLVSGNYFWKIKGPIAIIFIISAFYGFIPTISHFIESIKRMGS